MKPPRITIGMVVRNGERHIASAIESFLVQTMNEFTLIVHDNASTDATCSIVESFARRDSRITLRRRTENVGVLRNLIHAAEQASSERFCWAACDDVREPTFLQELSSLLDVNPDAGLACCSVRNIDPDGSPRDVRPETASLRTTTGMTHSQRVRMYLRELPGTPFYGLFRTRDLHDGLDTLRNAAKFSGDGPPLLGLDMVFLARFVRDHGLAFVPQPLLRFRRGGISHNIGRYGSLAAYFRQLRMFRSELRRATTLRSAGFMDRARVATARSRSLARWLLSREMRCMSRHYLVHSLPGAKRIAQTTHSLVDADLRRLRRRLKSLGDDTRIVLFGAGKHTCRRLDELRMAVRGKANVVGACDDHPGDCAPFDGLQVVDAANLESLRPDVILVSSDTYERSLFHRAKAIAPPDVRVWCLYDLTLETVVRESVPVERSPNAMAAPSTPASTFEMKDATSSKVSAAV